MMKRERVEMTRIIDSEKLSKGTILVACCGVARLQGESPSRMALPSRPTQLFPSPRRVSLPSPRLHIATTSVTSLSRNSSKEQRKVRRASVHFEVGIKGVMHQSEESKREGREGGGGSPISSVSSNGLLSWSTVQSSAIKQ